METKGIAPATPATERRQRTPLAVTRERVLGIAEQMFRQSGVQAVSVDARSCPIRRFYSGCIFH